MFFHISSKPRFDKATYLSFLFNFILFERLNYNLWGSDLLLFPDFINIVLILFYNFIEYIILLNTFLVICFAQYKEYIVWRISFSMISDVLPAFTCTRAIGNLWSICLRISNSSLLPDVFYIVKVKYVKYIHNNHLSTLMRLAALMRLDALIWLGALKRLIFFWWVWLFWFRQSWLISKWKYSTLETIKKHFSYFKKCHYIMLFYDVLFFSHVRVSWYYV